MSKKLYVGNLLYEVTDDQLKDYFSQAGNVVSAAVIRFSDSGRSKGFGFVEMETDEEAQRAIEMFHEQVMNERKLIVNEARPPRPPGERPPRRNNYGGGGGRGGNRGGYGGGYGGGRDRHDDYNN